MVAGRGREELAHRLVGRAGTLDLRHVTAVDLHVPSVGENLLHVATVQVMTNREAPYVRIQIGEGRVSNVNTKPVEDESTWA